MLDAQEIDHEIAEARLDEMINLAKVTGYPLDAILSATVALDSKAFSEICGNPSVLPKYIQSKVSEYL